MELRGDFSSYSEILDLLQIVSIGKKTGEVVLNSNGESITIQLKDGKIVNFKTNVPFLEHLKDRIAQGEISLFEAIKFLLHYVAMWNKGRFSFLEREVNEKPIGEADTITIMMDFTKEQDEIPDNLKEFFKKNPRFELSEEIPEPVTLDREDWKLFSLISKGHKLAEAIFSGADSFKGGLERAYTFKEKGLIKEAGEEEKEVKRTTEGSQQNAFVNPELFERIRELLIEAMGPMGEFLIEETFEDMDITRLPVNMIDAFVENLLEKIPDSCLINGESCREKLKGQITLILRGGANEP